MTDTLSPRGPDDEGVWYAGPVAIGHRRLAVIDIEGGRQPMVESFRDGRIVLTYSGEVYNYRTLRKYLESRGHKFRTRSDTEVVLRSYMEWGSNCVERLTGMFAFAVWDESEEQLIIARDRLGIKPLYYVHYSGGLLFGSEIKSLLANPKVTAEVDAEGLAEVLCMNTTPGHAVYRGIKSLPPGRIAIFSRTGHREITYWKLSSDVHEDDAATTVYKVRELLEEVVEEQLMSDVPLGVLLSGGIDSSVLAALSSNSLRCRGGDPLSTYSVHMAGSEEDFIPSIRRPELDRPFSNIMSDHVGSNHREILLDADLVLDAQHETMLSRDLPGYGSFFGTMYHLFRAVREDSTVVLSGESADELFGGYVWFHQAELRNRNTLPWAPSEQFLSVFSSDLQKGVSFKDYITARYHEAMTEVPDLRGEKAVSSRIREIAYLYLTRFVPALLDNKDRLSMRNGLEVRVPFCDHRLVQYVFNVPWDIKNAGGRPKGLLREATKDCLPRAIYERRKTGFPALTDPVFEEEIHQRLKDELRSPNSVLSDLVLPDKVYSLCHPDATDTSVWRSVDSVSHLLQIADWLRTYRVRVR